MCARKTLFLISLLSFNLSGIYAQQELKSTIAMQGGAVANAQFYVSHTIGQAVTAGTSAIDNAKIIQGFEFMISKSVKDILPTEINKEPLQLIITPNPFINFISVEVQKAQLPIEIHIFDVLGRLILEKTISKREDNNIDLKHLSQSKYFIQLQTNSQKFSTVLIKQNP